eukprot:9127183-Heterocapsa_arctica.AAC.1
MLNSYVPVRRHVSTCARIALSLSMSTLLSHELAQILRANRIVELARTLIANTVWYCHRTCASQLNY